MKSKQKNEAPKISKEDQERISRAARQVASYANFLRWSANFSRDEVVRHKSHDRVMLLSPMQSGRFGFAIEGNTVLLGVQDFEAAWMCHMPFVRATVSDRLYLVVESVVCMDVKLPDLIIGIFVDDPKKIALMSKVSHLQMVKMKIEEGEVSSIGRAISLGIPVVKGDIVKQLVVAAMEKRKAQDINRFF